MGHFGLEPFGLEKVKHPVEMHFFRAGYSQDRKHVPMAHLGCDFHGAEAAGQLLHDCDAVHGDSGSPIFVWHQGGFRIVAIHVSTLSFADGTVLGGAVGTEAFLATGLAKGGAREAHAPPAADPAAMAERLLKGRGAER